MIDEALRGTGRILARVVPVLLLVTLGTVVLLDLVPGDPAVFVLGDAATEDQIRGLRDQLGLDDPMLVRYADWLGNVFTGDLGDSVRTRQPVLEAIIERIPVTLQLAVLALVMAVSIAVPVALLAAYRQGGWFDRVTNVVASVSISSPSFLTALLLVLAFALNQEWFPVTGWVRLSDDPRESLRHALLPALTLAIGEAAVLIRVLRSDLVATLQEDFILLARAKGLPVRYILFRHALRPSSFSAITLTGLAFARIIGGAVVVEYIFALPGLGQLVINAVLAKDLAVVQGVVMFVAIAYVALNLLVDTSYPIVDPRVRGPRARA